MNAERLHAIANVLRDEMSSRNTTKKFRAMVEALRSVVQQSNQASQQNLSAARKALYEALTNTPSDRFSPSWRQILLELGGENLFGSDLMNTIEAIIDRNQITLAVALDELEKMLERLQAFEEALESVCGALSHFEIGDEKLAPGDSEIGVLIPRQEVKNKLLDFAEELHEVGFILNTFSEVATGQVADLEIRTLSSSDLLIYLQAAVPYAACVAVAVERVVTLYKQLLEIRKLHQQIRKQGVPDEQTSGIEQYANQLMESGIEKASVEIVNEFYKGKDKGRKHELVTKVRFSMNKIANRIDHGFNLEVRVEPPSQKQQPAPEDEEIQKAVTIIQAALPSMRFLKLEGKPLLTLPEAEKPKKKEPAE
ncbi:MAG: hypothetical protein L0Z53_25220 [Acidobacteriales bacterium]|nr:hypothetical protein [Terriglobales bacterium]